MRPRRPDVSVSIVPSRPRASPLMGCRLELATIDTRERSGTIRNVAMPHATVARQNPRQIPRLFLFTSTGRPLHTAPSPDGATATSQQTEAQAEVVARGRGAEWVRVSPGDVRPPSGDWAEGRSPSEFGPEEREGFGPRVTRGRVASGRGAHPGAGPRAW